MRFAVKRSKMTGTVKIPGSKSHTIRSIYIASLADGTSLIQDPLLSLDTEAAIRVCGAFGAEIKQWMLLIALQSSKNFLGLYH